MTNQYSYDIWGNPLTETGSVANPFRYSGEYWDSTTKLQYLRARWYDPSVGRFINEDTYEGDITNPLTLNIYTYVLNNPLRYIDPSGHREMQFDAGGDAYSSYEADRVTWNDISETVHTFLDFAGWLPVVGVVADGINAIIYLAEGNVAYALLSTGSMVPILE